MVCQVCKACRAVLFGPAATRNRATSNRRQRNDVERTWSCVGSPNGRVRALTSNHVCPRYREDSRIHWSRSSVQFSVFSFQFSVFSESQWCEAEIDLLSQALKPCDVVLDVGADIGCHAEQKGERLGVSPPCDANESQTLQSGNPNPDVGGREFEISDRGFALFLNC